MGWVSLLLFFILLQRFSLVLLVFLSPQKPNFLNSNLIWKQWRRSLSWGVPLQIPIVCLITVGPLLSGHFPKVPKYLSVKCCILYLFSTATPIKQPRPPFCYYLFSIYCFFTSIRRPELHNGKHQWRIILNKLSVTIFGAKIFTLLMQKGLRNLMFCYIALHIFLYILNTKR